MRNPAKAKNRATQRRNVRRHTNEAVIPVRVRNTPENGQATEMAEIPVAVTGSSADAPDSMIGKAEIPVTIPRSNRGQKQSRKTSAQHGLSVIPIARKRRKRTSRAKHIERADNRPLPSLPPMRHPLAERRDPFLGALNVAINVEETAVNVTGSFLLAAIGALETVTRLVLRAPAAIDRAREMGEEVIPLSLNEVEAELEEWPGARFAA